ncbi:MAG: hypothetical protein MJA29_10870 [Candidatus Omnitrophica bacterium]|nr:hypothetical protein [Candidatus Omnitrophota bacterium]
MKKTFLISAVGHAAVLGIFSFSFGQRILQPVYPAVAFWGQSLHHSQVTGPRDCAVSTVESPVKVRREVFIRSIERPFVKFSSLNREDLAGYRVKPFYSVGRLEAKQTYARAPVPPELPKRDTEPSLTLYPVLPYGFTLYFQDRQVAHVELQFMIVSAGLRNSVIVKRTKSSGNLDADLVSMRHISHYLFMQQSKIPRNTWHTVRIDLSAKEQ